MPIPCNSITEVLRELDIIIETSINQNDPKGIFAYIYRRTTAQIKSGIISHAFENPGRMEVFDVAFANRYLIAYRDYSEGKPVNACWKTAFDKTAEPLCILQHILLGMNAHINLDLGVAAAEVMTGKPILELENDFNKVNTILASLVDELQLKLGKVSRLMFLLDWVSGRNDESVIDFSMAKAREQSWRTATLVWAAEGKLQKETIQGIDLLVSVIAARINSPRSGIVKWILKLIRLFEVRNVGNIIQGLKS